MYHVMNAIVKNGNRSNEYPANLPEAKNTKTKRIRPRFPYQPFEYFTLEEKVESGLMSERTSATAFGLFSGLAIFVAIMGSWALSY